MNTDQLLIYFILYVLLPIWGLAGFADWCCHRATRIESTSGLKESLLHSLMGIQVGIPILLCLLYYVNVLILMLCILVWILHEAVAHFDVHYAAPRRKITIWEMHAHNYLATLPMYVLIIIAVINWPVVIKLFTFDWAGEFQLIPVDIPHGGDGYLPAYLTFMVIFCVFPYIEENLRCFLYWYKNRRETA